MITDRACRLLPVLSSLVFAACQERGVVDRGEGAVPSAEHIALLQRLEMEDSCNAVLAIAPDAVEQLRALDSGSRRGSLHGVPVLVKDNIHVAGMPTTAGSLALRENIAAGDAPIIVNSIEDMVAKVAATPGSIGYVNTETPPEGTYLLNIGERE